MSPSTAHIAGEADLRGAHVLTPFNFDTEPHHPPRAHSPWGLLGPEGRTLRWLADTEPRYCGWLFIDPRGRKIVLNLSAYATSGHDQVSCAALVNDALVEHVHSYGQGPYEQTGPVVDGLLVQGWDLFDRLHAVCLRMRPGRLSDHVVLDQLQWAAMGEDAACRWRSAGATSVHRSIGFAQGGLTPEQSVPWERTRFWAADVVRLVRRGWTAQQGQEFERLLPVQPRAHMRRQQWLDADLPAETVLLAVAAGLSAEQYLAQRPEQATLRILAALRGNPDLC